MTESGWVSSDRFATLASLSQRGARFALRKCLGAATWRGYNLVVREKQGRGGLRGKSYEVLADSLPPALRAKYEQQTRVKDGSALAPALAVDSDSDDWQRKLAWIRPAIAAREEGRPVGRALREITNHDDAPSFETLKRWLSLYDKRGVAGLQRKRRTDATKSKVMISKEWDEATVSLPLEKRREILAAIEQHIRSLYAAGTPSRRQVAHLATTELIKLTPAAEIEMTDAEARRVCRVPEHFTRRGLRFRIVATKRDDAKQFFDRHLPRIKRDRSSLLPMQCVAGDVHRADIFYRREDGSLATPRQITWLCLATNRVFATFVAFEKGKDVTQEHVIGSFIDMTQAWGMPSELYLDHGSEYGWTDFIEDALKCAAFTGCEMKIGSNGGITRARPYNAPGKVIESIFASLERSYFPMIPGFVGGDRMRAKTANVGKAPVPFPGSFEELRQAFATAINNYDLTPLTSGHLKGKSPRQAYEEHIKAGWEKTAIDRHLLEAVFAYDKTPRVDRGHIRVEGVYYYADELLDFSGQQVHVRVPKVGGDRSRLAVLDDAGRPLFFVEKAQAFGFGDRAGAIEQGRRVRVINESVAKLRAQTKPIDLVAAMERTNALQPPALVAQVGGRVTLSDSIHALAEARRSLPPPALAIGRGSEKQRRQYAALIGERPRKREINGQ